MLTKIKNIFIVLLLVLIVTQFLRPEKNRGSYDTIASFEEATAMPEEVKTILQNNCYDCHSNTTRYPWFMEVSPVTHYMAYQIEDGKKHFNISAWESYTDTEKDHKLEELIGEIEYKKMPLKPYTWIHGELSGSDAKTLIGWVKELREKAKNPPVDSINVQNPDSTVVDSLQKQRVSAVY
ncbi:heme-binding domain-containing protein [Aquimarina gracilis]|uniref:Heme-binding domain-containing protein n=1 Tax=Aquimarina gracilis TaxID=874422 RepID=A0ABU5ZUZ1_9FLAO|nr:heme-binding domain-containing protein [Aquimarina gracilis]MEB3345899.1 heme-binding domain-containing protein [Aquimarina gracilis]